MTVTEVPPVPPRNSRFVGHFDDYGDACELADQLRSEGQGPVVVQHAYEGGWDCYVLEGRR